MNLELGKYYYFKWNSVHDDKWSGMLVNFDDKVCLFQVCVMHGCEIKPIPRADVLGPK